MTAPEPFDLDALERRLAIRSEQGRTERIDEDCRALIERVRRAEGALANAATELRHGEFQIALRILNAALDPQEAR